MYNVHNYSVTAIYMYMPLQPCLLDHLLEGVVYVLFLFPQEDYLLACQSIHLFISVLVL